VPDPYDVLTIAAITDELSTTIGNGRVQRIGLVDARTIGAEVYAGGRRHYLLASADDRLPRLRLASTMPSLDPALITPFGLLLRKYVRGGIILGIDQPPLERLVRFSIAKRQIPLKMRGDTSDLDVPESLEEDLDTDEPEEAGEGIEIRHVSLYVELMGRHSNLILVDDDGLIMESAKRVTPDMSRLRVVLPRHRYVPPPPPDRLDPRGITPAIAELFLTGLVPDAEFARSFVSRFRGVSPTMAREIAYRITGEAAATAATATPEMADALAYETLRLLASLKNGGWSPRIYRERSDEGDGEIIGFTPVPMAHLAQNHDETSLASISEAAALAESATQRPSPRRHAQRRQRLLDAVSQARVKAERRLAALAGEAKRAAEAENLRRSGELIYAYLWQIEPGQRELAVEGETVRLDPGLSANENAQAYFEQYRKAQSAEAQLPGLEAESEAEIAYLDHLATFIDQAPGFSELEALAAEWSAVGGAEPGGRPKRKAAPRRPRPLVDAAGNSVYIGRSGPQNDLLTFEIAGPDDTWLHARGVAGSHVIVRWRVPGAPEEPETIAAAAALAAWYSAARESGGVEVDIARRRHVRKIKGGRPGLVTYRNEQTIRVLPAPEERLREILSER
jgi:predicted ribosome quality control (RQC) complex YloA/Tae2 family protein